MADTATVTIQPAASGPSLEEEAAAQAAAAQKVDDPKLAGEAPTRPDNVPEKFWDAEKGVVNTEALLASYAELEKAKSQPKGEGEGEAQGDAEGAAEKAVENAGLDMAALNAEFAEKGELSAESLAKLEAAGISKDMVDSYIAGQEAQATAAREALLEPVGGEEAYNEMLSWAADNMSDADIDAYNAVLEGGDAAAIKMAVENLHAKFTDANGSEPKVVLNGKSGEGSLSVYESTADMMKDMNNPEYKTNPAFRAKVEQKLARSNIM